MNPVEVYLKAAEAVGDRSHTYPCTAVYSYDGINWHQPESLARKFILTMAPGRSEFQSPAAASAAYIRRTVGTLREHSITALCLMAAMEAE